MSLNSVKVLEKYLISLLGLENSLNFTALFMPHHFLWNYYYFADENLAHPGLSKVAGCRRKSPPTKLVSAGYSAWHFFTDGVFLNKISLDWLLILITQPSISKLCDNATYP